MQLNILTTLSTAPKPTSCPSKDSYTKYFVDRAHLGASSRQHYAILKQFAARFLYSWRKRRWEREFRGNRTYRVRLSKAISRPRSGENSLLTPSWLISSIWMLPSISTQLRQMPWLP